jgi:hypothetical protein
LNLQGLTTGQLQLKFNTPPALCQGFAGPYDLPGRIAHNHFTGRRMKAVVLLGHAPKPAHQQHQHRHAQHHSQPNAKVQTF